LDYFDIDIIVLILIFYLFIAATVAKFGSGREVGGKKTLLVSLAFTPIVGVFYILSSPKKNTLKITHYRCTRCGLEYTDSHRYCPSCHKEGVNSRIEKIKMITY
jgi:ribosomal protein L37E